MGTPLKSSCLEKNSFSGGSRMTISGRWAGGSAAKPLSGEAAARSDESADAAMTNRFMFITPMDRGKRERSGRRSFHQGRNPVGADRFAIAAVPGFAVQSVVPLARLHQRFNLVG